VGPIGNRSGDSPQTLAVGDDGVVALGTADSHRLVAMKVDHRTGRISGLRCISARPRECARRDRRLSVPAMAAPLPRGRGFVVGSQLVVGVIGHPRGSTRLRPSTSSGCVRTAANVDDFERRAPRAARSCRRMRGVGTADALSVSPDGRHVYVVDDDALTVLRVTR
jgi:hypothetical protein